MCVCAWVGISFAGDAGIPVALAAASGERPGHARGAGGVPGPSAARRSQQAGPSHARTHARRTRARAVGIPIVSAAVRAFRSLIPRSRAFCHRAQRSIVY